MVCQGFRLGLRDLGKAIFQSCRDCSMQLRTSAPEQPIVGSIPYQDVLERIMRLWNFTLAEHQFRVDQLAERLIQFLFRESGYNAQQLIREVAARNRADLRHFTHWR